jgi:hypothetical protein
LRFDLSKFAELVLLDRKRVSLMNPPALAKTVVTI